MASSGWNHHTATMKKNKLTVPVSMTATLALIIAGTLSCGKNQSPSEDATPPPQPSTDGSNAPASDASAAATNSVAADPTNPAPVVVAETITNPPASVTPAPTPAPTPEPAPTLPIAPAPVKVVEMPATVPAAPTNFYAEDWTKNKKCCAELATSQMAASQDYYFRLRAGYQHVNHGDNNDTWFASVKFYARPDDLRERAGKNAWLIPDAEAEFYHGYLPKPDNSAQPGSAEGMAFRANLFWPWMHWTAPELCHRNAICPFSRSLTLALGPTANVGFDQIFDGDRARLARYGGARLTFNRDSFIEYTLGGTDGLSGDRQQLVLELPISQSRDGEVRYVLRGLWNRGNHSQPDELEGGVFLEMPFSIFATPSKWSDLIPFVK